ncbi:MAG TPA: glycosyltransferase family 9 protein [Candidatus Eisenbacteria bacterium]|nr:glycosyltransferase family 9 protein [Candidatus Eisenbacteria bacterium]
MKPPRPRTGRDEILILRALGLGDLLAALPALRGLRAAFPSGFLVLAAPAWLAPLALHSGAVDRVVPAEPLGPVPSRRPALAVNLHGRGPQSHRRLLETGPEALIAFRHPDVPESAGMPAWGCAEHEVRRWCRLLEESGIAADPARLDLDPTGLTAPPEDRGATVVHPGASSAARRWPAERWATVARHEADRGRRVLVTSGPGEMARAARVAEAAGLGPAALRSGGGLLRLAGLVAGARRVVSGDTGVAHLATALGRPSLVLFGPVSPAEWGPPVGPRHRALWSGRHGDPHGDVPDEGLLEIQPGQVIEALASLPS